MGHDIPDDFEHGEHDHSDHALNFSPEDRVAQMTAPREDMVGVSDSSRSNLVEEFRMNFKDAIRPEASPMLTTALMVDFLYEAIGEKPSAMRFNGDMEMEFVTKLKQIFGLFYQADSTIKRFALAHCLKGVMPWFNHFTEGRNIKEFADWICDVKNPNREYSRMTKQNVDKEVQYYYNKLLKIMPAMPLPEGMRKPEAREKMRQAAIHSHAKKRGDL